MKVKEIVTLRKGKGGRLLKLELSGDDHINLLQYAINDLMEKGAISIIKDEQEEQVYRLIFEEPKGNA